MVYAGHQFGNWVSQLGDGRAVLLGEVRGKNNQIYDIQLKGSGKTPYSRGGDGKAWLGPVIREYIISEYIFFLKYTPYSFIFYEKIFIQHFFILFTPVKSID